jgi:hypothetical protein
MLHASCLNIEAYINVGRDPWRRILNLLVAICSLFESPKTLNSLRNVSKWFRNEDWHSKRGGNRTKVMLDNKVPMNPTWVRLSR